MIKKLNKGFTLVELLVVIAIIGILATVVLVSLNSARLKARDARRITDIRQMSLALENYYDDQSSPAYPTDIGALDPNYLTVVPKDPQTNVAYIYNTNSCSPANQKYVLGATLENANHAALSNDLDGTQCNQGCNDPVYCIKP